MLNTVSRALNTLNSASIFKTCAPFIEQYSYRIIFFVIVGFIILIAAMKAHAERSEKKETERQRILRNFYTKELLQKSKKSKYFDKRSLFERPSLTLLNSNVKRQDYEKYLYNLIKSLEGQPRKKPSNVKRPTESTIYFRKLCLSLLDFVGLMKVHEAKKNKLPQDMINVLEKCEKHQSVLRRQKYKHLLEPRRRSKSLSDKKEPCQVEDNEKKNNENKNNEKKNIEKKMRQKQRFENKCCSNWKILNLLEAPKTESVHKQETTVQLMAKISSVTNVIESEGEEKKMQIDDEIEFIKMFDDWIRNGRQQESFLEMLDQKQKTGNLKKQHFSMFLVVFFDLILKSKPGRFNKRELEKLKSDFFHYIEKQEDISAITYEEKQDLEEHFFYMLARKQDCYGSEEFPYWKKDTSKVSSSTKLFQDILELLDYLSNRDSESKIAELAKCECAEKNGEEEEVETSEAPEKEKSMLHKAVQCGVKTQRMKKHNEKCRFHRSEEGKGPKNFQKGFLDFIFMLLTFWLIPLSIPSRSRPSLQSSSKKIVNANQDTKKVVLTEELKVPEKKIADETVASKAHGMGDCPAYSEQNMTKEPEDNHLQKAPKDRDSETKYAKRISDLWKTMATIIEQEAEYELQEGGTFDNSHFEDAICDLNPVML